MTTDDFAEILGGLLVLAGLITVPAAIGFLFGLWWAILAAAVIAAIVGANLA